MLEYMDDIEERLNAFALTNNLQVVRQMGFGIHGRVFQAATSRSTAVFKVFESGDSYQRERDVYLRLREIDVVEIQGCNVPCLLDFSDQLRVLEISLVSRPFCLDFAAAYLDGLPSYFSPMGEEWEAEKREQFGEDWPKVLRVLDELEFYGIYQTDVSPTNISV